MQQSQYLLDQLLVHGFIRLRLLNKTTKIPMDVLKLCLLWYHEELETDNLRIINFLKGHTLDIKISYAHENIWVIGTICQIHHDKVKFA